MSDRIETLILAMRRKATFFRRFGGEGSNETELLLLDGANELETAYAILNAIGKIDPEVIDTWGDVRFTSGQTNNIGHMVLPYRDDD